MSVPEELMKNYTQHRFEQQLQDEITSEAYNFIANCKNIKAILSGHLHKNFEGKVNDTICQITTGISTIREIHIY